MLVGVRHEGTQQGRGPGPCGARLRLIEHVLGLATIDGNSWRSCIDDMVDVCHLCSLKALSHSIFLGCVVRYGYGGFYLTNGNVFLSVCNSSDVFAK